jgi:hypothetical protein
MAIATVTWLLSCIMANSNCMQGVRVVQPVLRKSYQPEGFLSTVPLMESQARKSSKCPLSIAASVGHVPSDKTSNDKYR